jgi:hypothetical protein
VKRGGYEQRRGKRDPAERLAAQRGRDAERKRRREECVRDRGERGASERGRRGLPPEDHERLERGEPGRDADRGGEHRSPAVAPIDDEQDARELRPFLQEADDARERDRRRVPPQDALPSDRQAGELAQVVRGEGEPERGRAAEERAHRE